MGKVGMGGRGIYLPLSAVGEGSNLIDVEVMHITHDSILTLELPYRERLALRRTVFHGGYGPKVAVLSGIHGDELEGLYVCHRLAAWLEDLAATRPEA
jgi:predicted deacylase